MVELGCERRKKRGNEYIKAANTHTSKSLENIRFLQMLPHRWTAWFL